MRTTSLANLRPLTSKDSDALDVEDRLCQQLFESDSSESDDDEQAFIKKLEEQRKKQQAMKRKGIKVVE